MKEVLIRVSYSFIKALGVFLLAATFLVGGGLIFFGTFSLITDSEGLFYLASGIILFVLAMTIGVYYDDYA